MQESPEEVSSRPKRKAPCLWRGLSIFLKEIILTDGEKKSRSPPGRLMAYLKVKSILYAVLGHDLYH